MINLIPQSGKKIVHREYMLRVAAAWCLIAGAALLVSALLLVPTYVFLSKQLSARSVLQSDEAAVEAEYTRLSQELGISRETIDQLGRQTRATPMSAIVEHIEGARGDDVEINQITIARGGAIPSIVATGDAATRDALRGFVERLKRDAFFSEAVVPVSDLARDVNPAFTLTLTLRPETTP